MEELPDNKEEKVKTSLSFPLSYLPDELVLSCLARVSRSDYTALSLVSKKYRSLVVSPELYKMRLRLGCTEECMYVCLNPNKSTLLWFILSREKSSNWLTSQISSFPYNKPPKRFSIVALDWGIYVIGGWRKGKATSDVLLLDCRSNTWRKLPCMRVPRSLAAVGDVDGKIYVFGGRKDDIDSWGEVFDPKTQTWDTLVPLPYRKIRPKQISTSLVIEEKIYAVESQISSRGLYYSPSEGKWGIRNIDSPSKIESKINFVPVYVIVDKLLYCLDYAYGCNNSSRRKLFWCEKEEFKWKEVKGLDLGYLFKGQARFQKLSNFGENIVVFWYVDDQYSATRSKIWCAEISLDRHKEEDEIWGNVEWSNALITTLDHPVFDRGYMVSHSVSVNL